MGVSEDYLLFVDTETGGVTPGKDCVIEIAAILTDLNLVHVGSHCQKVKLRQGDLVSTEAAAINGYTAEAWKDAKPFSDFQEFLERKIPRGSVAIAVGHNVGFDRDMIDLGYYKPTRRFCPISYRKVDTVALAMTLRVAGVIEVPDVKLGTVTAALGIPPGKAHSAMDDCIVAKTIFERFVKFLKRARVEKAGVPA